MKMTKNIKNIKKYIINGYVYREKKNIFKNIDGI